MPIIIKDYNWRQTEELIIIRVPLNGASLKNVDIFTSHNYLKIHSPPLLFEICLWQPVLEAESSCTLADGEAVFRLMKQRAELWPSLSADLNRHEALQVKMKAVEKVQAEAKSRQEQNAVKKNERRRAAVKEQISLNTKEQDGIQRAREREKAVALAQMGWAGPRITEVTDCQQEEISQEQSDKEIFHEERLPVLKSVVPAPRQAAHIPVTFTPRMFPTPCRESKMAEEQEWLSKQAEARRRTGFVAEDLRPEERDPVWLCDKAQSFYNVGNYLGAVSAYSHALTMNSKLYEVYSGRAAAYLALGNFTRALTDSSKALELLTPAVSQNAEARAQCLLCRSSALAGLGLRSEALGELRAAQDLKPDCPDIQAAIARLQA